jgi:hypothetical protein
MPIGNVIKPFLLRRGGTGLYYHYSVGEFRFEYGEAHDAYIMAHLENGRCENDDVPLTAPRLHGARVSALKERQPSTPTRGARPIQTRATMT